MFTLASRVFSVNKTFRCSCMVELEMLDRIKKIVIDMAQIEKQRKYDIVHCFGNMKLRSKIRCLGPRKFSPNFKTFEEPKNRFQGPNSFRLCSLACRYDNLIPTRFLAPIDCLKIPTQMKVFQVQVIHLLKENNLVNCRGKVIRNS